MNKTNEIQTWEIRLLTPLHVGDGEELQENLDYFVRGHCIEVVDLESLLPNFKNNPMAISEIGHKGFALDRLAREYSISIPTEYKLPYTGKAVPKSIRRFIKNAYGQPYLPGSSLKGAIRTALWTSLSRTNIPSAVNYQNFEKSVAQITGKDPHHDFLRPLQVSDSMGISPEGLLQVDEIKFFNVRFEDKPGWKNLASKKSTEDFSSAEGVYVESLKPSAVLHVKASLSVILRNPWIQKLSDIPGCVGLDGFSLLAETINKHTSRIVNRELAFFDGFGSATAAAKEAYISIISELDALKDRCGAFVVRLAWGSGWRGMTGDWLKGEDLDAVRRKKRLGKITCPFCGFQGVGWDNKTRKLACRNDKCRKTFDESELWVHPIFPKTRRLAMEKGLPSVPLGWISVTPVDLNAFKMVHIPMEFSDNGSQVGPDPKTALGDPKEHNSQDPEEVRKIKLEGFQSRLKTVSNLQGEINRFFDELKSQEDDALKRDMCAELLSAAKSLKKSKYNRALKDNKSWAKALEKLSHDLGIVP